MANYLMNGSIRLFIFEIPVLREQRKYLFVCNGVQQVNIPHQAFNTPGPNQYGCHFADDIFKAFSQEYCCILIDVCSRRSNW